MKKQNRRKYLVNMITTLTAGSMLLLSILPAILGPETAYAGVVEPRNITMSASLTRLRNRTSIVYIGFSVGFSAIRQDSGIESTICCWVGYRSNIETVGSCGLRRCCAVYDN